MDGAGGGGGGGIQYFWIGKKCLQTDFCCLRPATPGLQVLKKKQFFFSVWSHLSLHHFVVYFNT